MSGDNVDVMFKMGIDKLSGRSKNDTACFAEIGESVGSSSKKLIAAIKGTACHGSISSHSTRKPQAFVSRIQTGHCEHKSLTPEDRLIYVNWLVNDSNYAEPFLIKDAERIIAEGHFIVGTNFPANEVGQSLVSSRRVSEHVHIARITAEFIKAGCDGHVGYLIAHFLRLKKEGLFYSHGSPEHYSLYEEYFSKEFVHNWLVNKNPLKRPLYTENPNYHGYPYSWGRVHGEGGHQGLYNKLKGDFSHFEAVKLAVINPFTTSSSNQEDTVNFEQWCKAIPEIEKAVKEWANVKA